MKNQEFIKVSSEQLLSVVRLSCSRKNFLTLSDVRELYKTCMDTETLKKQGLTEIKEMIARLGGWPVVEGEGWKGEKNFTWHKLSIKAAREGSTAGDFLEIGKNV